MFTLYAKMVYLQFAACCCPMISTKNIFDLQVIQLKLCKFNKQHMTIVVFSHIAYCKYRLTSSTAILEVNEHTYPYMSKHPAHLIILSIIIFVLCIRFSFSFITMALCDMKKMENNHQIVGVLFIAYFLFKLKLIGIKCTYNNIIPSSSSSYAVICMWHTSNL